MSEESDELACPECGATEQDLLGHQVQGVYDGVLFWSCRRCGHAWPRDWEEGTRRHYKARDLAAEWNRKDDKPLIPYVDPKR